MRKILDEIAQRGADEWKFVKVAVQHTQHHLFIYIIVRNTLVEYLQRISDAMLSRVNAGRRWRVNDNLIQIRQVCKSLN